MATTSGCIETGQQSRDPSISQIDFECFKNRHHHGVANMKITMP